MAKVRVYELAKEFNMTNKAFMDKLEEMGIKARSHMSSLEDEQVSFIKNKIFGKGSAVSEVKIRPSVIRRRKAKGDQEPSTLSSEPSVTEETISSEKETESKAKKAEKIVKKKVVKQKSDKAVKEKTAEKKVAVKKSAKKKSDEEQTTEKKIVEKAVVAKKTTKEEKKKEPKEEKTAEVTPKATKKDSKKDKKTKDNKKASKETTKAKKKKKKKSSEPAKIVKLADPSAIADLKKKKETGAEKKRPKPNKAKQKQERQKDKKFDSKKKREVTAKPKAVPAPQADPQVDVKEPSKRSKKKKKDIKDNDLEQDIFGEKKRVKKKRKKSIVEGAALYERNKYGRKKSNRKGSKVKRGDFQKTEITTPKAIKRRIKIDETIELAELAKRMGVKASEMMQKLMKQGVMVTLNQTIDFDTASLVAAEFEYELEKASFEEDSLLSIQKNEEDESKMQQRAPVVTIMGHVDHGKTSLLDVIRKAKVTADEAGGITQHIGAYKVKIPGGDITFLDTPGHAAFTSMRARGAQVTDIVVLVVAADDGVMPQTIEAINHSKQAKVPVVVAVNKMDKEGADPSRIMRELSEHELLSEEWGGEVIFVEVSAKAETGIDTLLEMILLQSEVLELKANPDRKAFGYVVESRLDTGRGAIATVLIQHGTLKDGDSVVCGHYSGKIRTMTNDQGKRIKSAGPSIPVEIVGLNGVPDAGDEMIAVFSDKDAKQISENRMQKQRAKELAKKSRANLESLFQNLGTDKIQELKLIVKADVQGSIEAVCDSLKELAKDEVDLTIVHSAVGTVNESDISLAAVSDAIVLGFNVRPGSQVRNFAKDEGVDMRFYDVIYDLINDIKSAIEGLMPSIFEEKIIGRAEVRDTFFVTNVGTIAGSFVMEGKVIRGKRIRLLRDGVVKCDGELSSLKRFKDDAKEVVQDYECGIGIKNYNDIKLKDIIECYEVIEKRPGAE
ncbi:MAG: translation initiation factor IF-2 [Desulfobacteraceae bacterium]|nr:translation initiation factor IF-2 [Desulfobacteraceae bacterium]